MKRIVVGSINTYNPKGWDLDDFVNMLKECQLNAIKNGYCDLRVEFEEEWWYDTCSHRLNITGREKN